MKTFKKLVALGLTVAMVFGSSIAVFADETTQDQTTAAAKTAEGTGTEIFVNKNAYKITIPTDALLAKAFDFTVDPQGLVAATEAAAYDGATVEDGAGVLFANKDTTDPTKVAGLSSVSDPLVITNKSATPVNLAIEAQLTGTATYDGGFSTTADFSGENDGAKGLYLGLRATGELEKNLSTTKDEFNNIALTAADKYEVTYASNAYTFAPIDNASGFPTYEFTVKGALNPDVAASMWATVADNTVTVKTMPKISVKFTPSSVKDTKEANVIVDGADFYISKSAEEGGFGETKPAYIEVNGKALTTINDNVDGYVKVTWEDIYKAYGYDKEEDIPDVDALYGLIKTFRVNIGGTVTSGALTEGTGVDYYAELPNE